MEQKYDNLFSLLNSNNEAQQYFDTLPDYVKEAISERANGINSYESLRHCADNFTKGDD